MGAGDLGVVGDGALEGRDRAGWIVVGEETFAAMEVVHGE
jgi:hypothetical protein